VTKEEILKDLNERMQKSISSLEHDLKGLRSGRASPNLLDPVVVEAYGDKMPITQLSTVSNTDSRTLSVQVWDKQMVKVVEKGIANANLGLSTSTDGQIIRINIPALSEERRKELAKLAAKYGENGKVSIRNVRRDVLDVTKKLEKNSSYSKDEIHLISEEVQKITDLFIKKIDEKIIAKETEIMDVSR
jgi:ribosome recycling factor